MNSLLTTERPDIWQRGLDLATGLTGYLYLPKLPASDGTIFACGGYIPPPTPAQRRQRIDDDIRYKRERIKEHKKYPDDVQSQRLVIEYEHEIEELIKKRDGMTTAAVLVPDGAMEWLLHEVGHWIAASPEERKLPNYGDGHEIEAWAFEEIVLGRFGSARQFAPPTQRDGTAFDVSGPLPGWAFRHIERRTAADRVAVEQFQALWAEWVRWGVALGHRAPWSSESLS